MLVSECLKISCMKKKKKRKKKNMWIQENKDTGAGKRVPLDICMEKRKKEKRKNMDTRKQRYSYCL